MLPNYWIERTEARIEELGATRVVNTSIRFRNEVEHAIHSASEIGNMGARLPRAE